MSWTWQVLISQILNGFLLFYQHCSRIIDFSVKVTTHLMKSLVEEEQRTEAIMMLNMMNFLKDFQSIFLKLNIPKKMAFQKDNLNLEMIVKLRRIDRISKTIASKKSQIWKDRFMRCKVKISRMGLRTFPIKIISMDLWIQTRILNLRKNLSLILKEMNNFWIKDLMIN